MEYRAWVTNRDGGRNVVMVSAVDMMAARRQVWADGLTVERIERADVSAHVVYPWAATEGQR